MLKHTLSQSELARRLGVTLPYINLLIRDKKALLPTTLVARLTQMFPDIPRNYYFQTIEIETDRKTITKTAMIKMIQMDNKDRDKIKKIQLPNKYYKKQV